MTYFYKQVEEMLDEHSSELLNLSNEEIIEYADIFIREDGLTKNKTYIKLAKITGKSRTTIQRIYTAKDKPKETETLLYIFYNTETKRTKIGISEDVYRRLIQLNLRCKSSSCLSCIFLWVLHMIITSSY